MRGEWKIIIGSALFALIPVGVKLAEGAGIYSILAGRLLIAAVVIFIFSKEKLFQLNKKDIIHLVLWSALMLVAMLCYFQSIRTCGVAISSALLGAQPVLIIIFSVIILREKASWWVSFCALLTVL
ncbi:MAG: EamA family transporter, partial [Bacteroidetes bacterium]|nr:EamA family transporter [Bacteroidota bacterium]